MAQGLGPMVTVAYMSVMRYEKHRVALDVRGYADRGKCYWPEITSWIADTIAVD